VLELKPPDPTAADHVLAKVTENFAILSALYEKVCQKEKRLPDWKERQVSAFIKYVGLYTEDLREAYRRNRIDSVAQAMRNLMELNVWLRYCELSLKDGKRFFDDGYRDMRDMMETLRRLDTGAHKEPKQMVEDVLVELKNKATAFAIDDYDAAYLKVNDAAGKIGTQAQHSVYYKVASKFAHPTAMLFLTAKNTDEGMLDALYDVGARVAAHSFSELEKIITTAYSDLMVTGGVTLKPPG
jgi:hypothetical protein